MLLVLEQQQTINLRGIKIAQGIGIISCCMFIMYITTTLIKNAQKRAEVRIQPRAQK